MKLSQRQPTATINVTTSIDGQNSSIKSSNNYVWRDEKAPFTLNKTTGVNNPSFGEYTPGFSGLLFSGSNMNEVWVDFHIDHDIALGTYIYPHVHWMPLDNLAGTVRWGFQYLIAKGHGQSAFPSTPTTIVLDHTFPVNSKFKHFVTETPIESAILSSEIEPDAVIKMRVYRLGNEDTYNSNVHAWQADLHLQIARIGTINKAPNFYGT